MNRRIPDNANLQWVVDTEVHGTRLYLKLACGHLKLHNPINQIPRRSYCYEKHERKLP
jgi:hypothetical protein